MHYYQHHIGDFTKDTANLNDHQVATYLRMIWLYYSDEKPLTLDLDDLAFLVRSEAGTVRLLCKHYFTESPEGWRHARCDREIFVVGEKSEKARISAEKRWNNANAMRTHTENDANACKNDATQHPTPNTQHPTPKEEKRIPTSKTTPLTAADQPELLPDLADCPHKTLIDLFAQKLPTMAKPRAELWNGKSAENLKARWRWVLTAKREDGQRYAENERQALAWFGKFFDAVQASDFLTGRRGDFVCTLQWLVNAANFGKVVQGNYDNRGYGK
jgi:uncharacterized protein YdaU (DUF1376 family)